MKKLFVFTVSCCLLGSTLFGALSPLNQSIRELKAILSDKRLAESLGEGSFIQDIEHTREGYVFTTSDHEVTVEVKYHPPKKIGPREFDLIFHNSMSIP